MSKKKRTILPYLLVLALAFSGMSLIAIGLKRKSPEKHTHIDTSIVRLHDADTGAFFCSGVVISNDIILTAAHCVIRQDAIEAIFGTFHLLEKIEIRAEDGKSLGIFATTLSANPRQDVAALLGQFSLFDKREVEIAPKAIEVSFMKSRNIIACGYPSGGSLVCTTVKNVAHLNFGFSANGFLYPGMSGGPVIDEETGKVIAVNTAVIDSRIYLSPTIELYTQLGLNEQAASKR